jgi:hypothetical protein
MALNDFRASAVHGSIVLADGTGTPVTLTSLYDLGDIAVTGLSGPKANEVVHHQRRGKYVSSSYGARRFPQLTFSNMFVGETSSAPGSVAAFAAQATPYTANVSTLGSGRVYAVKITVNIEMSDFSGTDWSTVFNSCVLIDRGMTESMEGNTVNLTFEVMGSITGDITYAQIS